MLGDGAFDLGFEGGTAGIRFIAHLPYFWLAYMATSLFNDVLDKPELLHAPYSPNIGPGQGVASIAACLGAAWNFFAFVPLYMFCGGRTTVLCICVAMDTALSIAFAYATHLQSTYLPHPLGQCGNAINWHPKDAPSMFLVLILPDRDDWSDGQIHETVKEKCHEFVYVWIGQIVILVLEILALISVVRLCCAGRRNVYYWGDTRSRTSSEQTIFWRFLAPHARWRTRLREKSMHKPLTRAASTHLVPFSRAWIPRIAHLIHRIRLYASGGAGQERPDLENQPDPVDSAATALLCGAVTLYGSADSVDDERLGDQGGPSDETCRALSGAHLSPCIGKATGQCYCCGNQYCSACRKTATVDVPRTLRHFSDCRPLCSDCYYRDICHDPRSTQFQRPMACTCRDVPANAVPEQRQICQKCGMLRAAQLAQVRENKDIKEMAHIAGAGLYCSSCAIPLTQPGPLWWQCRICMEECDERCHVPWQVESEESEE